MLFSFVLLFVLRECKMIHSPAISMLAEIFNTGPDLSAKYTEQGNDAAVTQLHEYVSFVLALSGSFEMDASTTTSLCANYLLVWLWQQPQRQQISTPQCACST